MRRPMWTNTTVRTKWTNTTVRTNRTARTNRGRAGGLNAAHGGTDQLRPVLQRRGVQAQGLTTLPRGAGPKGRSFTWILSDCGAHRPVML